MVARPRGAAAFLMAGVALVAIAIGGGLYVLGSPSAARAGRLDERRVRDLQQCAVGVAAHWRKSNELPASNMCAFPDPVTGRPYGYQPKAGPAYELCAVFDAASPPDAEPAWRHQAGRTCYTLDARDLALDQPAMPIRR